MNRFARKFAFLPIVCFVSIAGSASDAASEGRGAGDDWLPEAAITAPALRDAFARAFDEAEVVSPTVLRVARGGVRTLVRVVAEKRLVAFSAAWQLAQGATERQRLDLLQRLHSRVFFSRFTALADGKTLLADYFVPFRAGVSARKIVRLHRLFTEVTSRALAAFDSDDVVR